MKFRHSDGVRVALISGHVTSIGPDWRELDPIFHREALAKGCECDQSSIRTQDLSPQAGEGAVVNFDEAGAIRVALIRMIERNGNGDFTGSGAPNLKVLAKEAGFKIDKEIAMRVWHELEEEAQSASAEGGDQDGSAGGDAQGGDE